MGLREYGDVYLLVEFHYSFLWFVCIASVMKLLGPAALFHATFTSDNLNGQYHV